VFLVYFGILLFALAIVAKLVYIQWKEGPALLAKAQKQEIKIFNLKADRGNILSAKGDLLATSVPVFEVRMDVANDYIDQPLFNEKLDSLSLMLARLFRDKSARAYRKILLRARHKGNRFLLLQRHVTYDQLKQLRQFPILRRGRNRGGLIALQKTTRRLPFGLLAARTIGYENKKEGLFVGLEGAYSNVLAGKDGKQIKRRINHGAWIPVHDESEVEPQDGLDVVSSIDVNLQDVAEEALMKQLEKHEARMGCAILMQVKTGDIKAIANLRYDKKRAVYTESYNMAIGEKFEPGSTFKLASVMVALEDHKIHLNDTLNIGKGYIVYYNRALRDVHAIGNGRITVREAFEHSSNVGISKMIFKHYKSNPQQFINRLYQMGLNQPLGIELAGEAKPYIKNPTDKKHWYLTSLPWMSVGYELELTPLQILTFYNAVANNGVKVKPRFVKEITDGGLPVKKIGVKVLNQRIASPQVIAKVRSLLEGVVQRGTAQVLKNEHFTIAGKTGTAKISENGQYISAYNATFVGYFPADDPQYSCIVVVNKPKHSYYGSAVAAPVFKEIANKVYATSLALSRKDKKMKSQKALPEASKPAWYPDLKTFYSGLGLKQRDYLKNEWWAKTVTRSNTVDFKSHDFPKNRVPDLKGMRAKDAIYLVENMGMLAEVKGRGFVRSQSLKPGSSFKKGQKVMIQLSIY
jgi:cell division protein FtsI (penicillin-binding protein 3)